MSWHTLVRGYVQNEYHEEAIKPFCQMQWKSMMQDEFTFANVLSACVSLETLQPRELGPWAYPQDWP